LFERGSNSILILCTLEVEIPADKELGKGSKKPNRTAYQLKEQDKNLQL
jgi:hypothetical protein